MKASRMKSGLRPILALLMALGACSAGRDSAPMTPQAPPDWRSVVTDHDRGRLHGWRDAWTRALAKARAAGHGPVVDREGKLLQPDAALSWREPPAGDYRCRVIKIGAKSEGMLDYIAYPRFACRIQREAGLLSFAKLTGSQRPIGLLFPHAPDRMVFLGTLQLGDEQRALQYGTDRERDMAGLLERVGDNRWRLVFPFPHFESTLDVIELVPAA